MAMENKVLVVRELRGIKENPFSIEVLPQYSRSPLP